MGNVEVSPDFAPRVEPRPAKRWNALEFEGAELPPPRCDSETYHQKAVEWPIPHAVVASVDAMDMNQDGYPDIVLAEGSDMPGAEGYLRIVWNPNRPAGPDWATNRKDSWFRVRVSDMNSDGMPDVVGTIYRPTANGENSSPSDLAFVYLSKDGALPMEPSAVIGVPGNLIGSGVHFADVNGDNMLDMGLLTTDMATRQPHPFHFYATTKGGVSSEPIWSSETKIVYQSGASTVDINQDGALDLLIVSEMPQYLHVFLGVIEDGRYHLSTRAEAWTYPDHQKVVATTIDVATSDQGMRVLVGFNDQFCPDNPKGTDPRERASCDGPLTLINNDGQLVGTAPWRHMWGAARFLWFSKRDSAIFGAHWNYTLDDYGNKIREPGPAVLYCGTSDDPFQESVELTPGVTYFGIDSTVADFDQRGAKRMKFRHQTRARLTQGLGLPPRVAAVHEVLVHGRPLDPAHYTVTPGATAISFAPPLPEDSHIEMLLETSWSTDIAVADVNPQGRDSIPIISRSHSPTPPSDPPAGPRSQDERKQ
ncbi:MAG: VCBS repeat-containing protein [Nannocystaceae bacterium]